MAYYRKYRLNKEYFYKRSFSRLIICLKKYFSPEMYKLIKNLDHYIETSEGPFFKKSPIDTTTVVVIKVNQHTFVVKRYNFRNLFHGLKLRFRPSRAMRNWVYAHRLQTCGINTLKPVAVVEKRVGLLWGRGYFISEFIDGLKGCEYFANESDTKPYWPRAIAAIEKLTKALQKNHLHHSDYHFGNLMMIDHEPLLIDLDKMKFISNSERFKYKHEKDLNNFREYLRKNKEAYQAFQDFQSEEIF